MEKKEFKKPKVKIYSTENELRCCELFVRQCIAHPVTRALREAGHPEKAREFLARYKDMFNRTKWAPGRYGCPTIVQRHFYYHEFFELAGEYVDLEISKKFQRHAQDSDDDARIKESSEPEL